MAAGAAFVLPFEVFLLAYAVLGPLHYLTEISWLHDREYFLPERGDYLPLLVLCAVAVVVSLTHWLPQQKSAVAGLINYTAFGGAAVLLMTKTTSRRIASFALIALSFLIAAHSETCRIFFGIFLPTIVHVFIFTAGFVALGALRGRSRSGLMSLCAFALCTMTISFAHAAPIFPISTYAREAYLPFERLNLAMLGLFRPAGNESSEAIYHSAEGLAVMRFIAFAYLYHYLNWFSKTSIVQWNRISTFRALAIVAVWIALVWLYAKDSRTGLVILMTLSLLHGFLELPLDHQTFVKLTRELLAMFTTRSKLAGKTSLARPNLSPGSG